MFSLSLSFEFFFRLHSSLLNEQQQKQQQKSFSQTLQDIQTFTLSHYHTITTTTTLKMMRNAGGGRRDGLRRGGLFHVNNRHRRRSFGFLGLDLPRCILLLAAALCVIGGAINVHSMNAHHDAHVKASASSSTHAHGTGGVGASKSSFSSSSAPKVTTTKKAVEEENEDIDDLDDIEDTEMDDDDVNDTNGDVEVPKSASPKIEPKMIPRVERPASFGSDKLREAEKRHQELEKQFEDLDERDERLKGTLEFNRAEAGFKENGEDEDDESAIDENRKVENGKTYENVGGMWVEVDTGNEEVIKIAEKNMGRVDGAKSAVKMKDSEYMKLAREAARDKEKFKDPETKRLLRRFGLDTHSQQSLTESMKKKAQEKILAIDKAKREEAAQGAMTKPLVPHPALLVPMTRSRGIAGCGVCTNATGGHFAKGVGCTINGGAYNIAWNENDGHPTVNGGLNNRAKGAYATINGGYDNEGAKDDSTVNGGGQNRAFEVASTVNGGELNMALKAGSVANGGANNVAGGVDSVVNGGVFNKAIGDGSCVGGGEYNNANGVHSSVLGGALNSVSYDHGAIVGGLANSATSNFTVIVGGGYNKVEETYGVIVGGYNNTVKASDATIVGGSNNEASGGGSHVAGGENNKASGQFSSVLSGRLSSALHKGSVVFGDASLSSSRSTNANQVVMQHDDVRKTGGGMFIFDEKVVQDRKRSLYTKGTEVIRNIAPKSYVSADGSRTLFGIAASDVGKIAPEMLVKNADGSHATDPTALVYMLVNALKEQDNRIKALEAKAGIKSS